MPTLTDIAKATKKKREIKLVGIDMYLITEKGIPKFDDIGPFTCEFISNRGTKVWPGFVSPDLLMVNWYRVRFMATKDVQDADVGGGPGYSTPSSADSTMQALPIRVRSVSPASERIRSEAPTAGSVRA